MDTLDPELDVAVAAMVAENARFVVIGGFAVIANRFIRATEDIDFLGRRHRQRQACVGRPDQRLADRPRDRNDLIGLAEVHG